MLVRLALAFAAAALFAVPLALAPGAASAAATPSNVQAERYFTCPTGYTFAAANDAAHCKKRGRYGYRALVDCPNNFGVGLFEKTDAIGYKDMCTGTNPVSGEVAVERGCPVGFTKRIIRGPDSCRVYHPAEIVAPSVAVTR
jgi:hypothetical protein